MVTSEKYDYLKRYYLNKDLASKLANLASKSY